MRFLRTFHLQKYIRDSRLSLNYIHFQGIGQSLDLQKASARGNPGLLAMLSFGPANTPLAPTLACPSPGLTMLKLTAPFGRTMKWRMVVKPSIGTICFPHLEDLRLRGDVSIWDQTTLAIIGASSRLLDTRFEEFSGSSEELIELMVVLAAISGESDGWVAFSIGYADKTRVLESEVPPAILDEMKDEQRLEIFEL